MCKDRTKLSKTSFLRIALSKMIICFCLIIIGFLGRYALYGEVSPKLDVYAFGVVLFEIISGRVAIAAESSSPENRTPREGRTLCSLVGPLCLLNLCSCFFSFLVLFEGVDLIPCAN